MPDWSVGALDLFAVYPSRRHVQPKISAFVELLIEAFRPFRHDAVPSRSFE
jgi:DNA-binding transcriptional LysR family regulator